MKKLLLILICLFVSFEVRSDVVEDLSKNMNVSRLEYSLDKLIPELKLEVFGNDIDFQDDRRYEYYDKICNGSIGKFDWKEYKTDKEMIGIGCRLNISTQYFTQNEKKIPDEEILRNFNYLADELMEIYTDKIAKKIFSVLGNYGNQINIPVFLRKFNNKYNLNKFLRDSKVTEIQEDYVNLLKERIVLIVSIDSFSRNARVVSKGYLYPFSQKWESGRGIPKFEKIKFYDADNREVGQ